MRLRAAITALALAAGAPAHGAAFGEVELVTGQVTVQAQDGRVSSPRVGDTIPAGAELVTGRDGELHVATADSGYVALRPNTRLRVTDYRAEGGADDIQVLVLLRGTFRSITGWIAQQNTARYRVATPAATIGVRGTDHEPSYWTADDLAGEPDLEPGTYDKVNEGRSYIENEVGRVEVAPGQAGFAKLRGRPARLGRVPYAGKATAQEKRSVERREILKKVRDKRRAERLQQRLDRQDERQNRKKQQRERLKDRLKDLRKKKRDPRD